MVATETEVAGSCGRLLLLNPASVRPTRGVLPCGDAEGFVDEWLQRLAYHLSPQGIFARPVGRPVEDLLQQPRYESLRASAGI